jgi:2-(1,2-epoxy-1,2-dihydrophenyl)acetyl-CoA isomerase
LETEPVTALAAAALADCSQQHLVMNRKTFKGSPDRPPPGKGAVPLNRLLSADEAMAWGFVNRVVALEELSATVDQVAKQLASGPTLAFASVKRLLLLTGGADLEQQMKHESVSIVQMSRSRDGLAGVKAFKDKVEPSFVGS